MIDMKRAVSALGLGIVIPAGLFAIPAYASANVLAISEPNPIALIALGLAGVIVGRRFAMGKPPRD